METTSSCVSMDEVQSQTGDKAVQQVSYKSTKARPHRKKEPNEERQNKGKHGPTVNTTLPLMEVPSSSVNKRPERARTKKRKYTETDLDDDDVSEYHPSDNDETKESGRKRRRVKTTNIDGKGKKRPFHPSVCPAYQLGCTALMKRDSDSLRHFQSSCKFNDGLVEGADPIVKIGDEGWEKISLGGKSFYLPILNPKQYRECVLERVGPRCICGKEFKRKDAVRRHQAKCAKAHAQGVGRRRRKSGTRRSV